MVADLKNNIKTKDSFKTFPKLSFRDSYRLYNACRYPDDKSIHVHSELASKYSNGYVIKRLRSDTFVINNPELAKEVLSDTTETYLRADPNLKAVSNVIGSSSIVSDGIDSKKKRIRVQDVFKKTHLDEYAQTIRSEVLPLVQLSFDKYAKNGKKFNVAHEIYKSTFMVASCCLLGYNLTARERNALMNLSVTGNELWFQSSIISLLFNKRLPKFILLKLRQQYIYTNIIKNQKKLKSYQVKNNLLASLLDQCGVDYPESFKMSTSDVISELSMNMATNHLSVGTTTMFTLLELLKHPGCLDEFASEGRAASFKNETSAQKIANLPFSRLAIREVLRLYPIVWNIYRNTAKDVNLQGYSIPKGSTVIVNAFGLGRNPRYWDEPNEFQPERFLTNYNKYAFLPFGYGHRTCPANAYTYVATTLILQFLLNNYEFEVDSPDLLYSIQPQLLCTLMAPQDIRMRVSFKK